MKESHNHKTRAPGWPSSPSGVPSLAWPELNYTKATQDVKPGPLEFSVKEKDSLRIPAWVDFLAIAGGTVLIWRRKG